MKRLTLAIAIMIFSGSVFADQVWVDGYYRKDGTYVQGHYRTTPDSHQYNNYGRKSQRDSSGPHTPYLRDQDNDGIYNQYDLDDDNDGILDDYE
jgi:hypothetical protein